MRQARRDRSRNPELIDWVSRNMPGHLTRVYTAYQQMPGFDLSLVDLAVVGCYKTLNGVGRPCMDALSTCESIEDPKRRCWDEKAQKVRSALL